MVKVKHTYDAQGNEVFAAGSTKGIVDENGNVLDKTIDDIENRILIASFVGKGQNYAYEKKYDVINRGAYYVYPNKRDWGQTQIETEGSTLNVDAIYKDGSSENLIMEFSNISEYMYEIHLDANKDIDYLEIGGRADLGVRVDITMVPIQKQFGVESKIEIWHKLLTATGALKNYADYCTSQLLPVPPSSKITFHIPESWSPFTKFIEYGNDGKTIVEYWTITSDDMSIKVSGTTNYIRLPCFVGKKGETWYQINGGKKNYLYYNSDVSDLSNELSIKIQENRDQINDLKKNDIGMLADFGSLLLNAEFDNKNKIYYLTFDVKPASTFEWFCGAATMVPPRPEYKLVQLNEYDEQGAYIDQWSALNGDPRKGVLNDRTHSIKVPFMYADDVKFLTYLKINGQYVFKSPKQFSFDIAKNRLDINSVTPTINSKYGCFSEQYPFQADIIDNQLSDKRTGKRLQFIHISDNHGFSFEETSRMLDVCPAKFLINTGDLVFNDFADKDRSNYYTMESALAAKKPTYLTLGNHDPSGAKSLRDRFDAFIAPLNDKNGLIGNTKTYYSVDFSSEGVKCIILDPNDGIEDASNKNPYQLTVDSVMTSEQINWFVNQLIDARTNKLHVCVFIHAALDSIEEIIDYTFYDGQVEVARSLSFLPKIVDAWIDGKNVTFEHNGSQYDFTFSGNGVFVAWFTGHTHYDAVGWYKIYPNQLCVTITRSIATNEYYNTTMYNSKCDNVANYVTIDTKLKRISILRIGEYKTPYGTEKKSISFSYR